MIVAALVGVVVIGGTIYMCMVYRSKSVATAQAFDISGGEIRHRGRFVETAKRRAELDAGHMLWPAFGTPLAGGLPVARPDTINTANISLLHHAGELLALWEGGSPHRLAPQSLETLGPNTWRADLRGA